ncbi:hypothetical protein DNK06_14755 [Pseudomonas daroniae]|uniref:DUF3322 and DUF2220 domain-containing protein n=1 Tax=Phytopseudomonas daroniae TaxID=2487519 RepID=A0A4Q9QKS7_9GAMM|nr:MULTISPECIES: DUF3322 domain-containing protein [Pseudomonas]TBU77575.1 hypothetical protein DNK06_14755 [Pseudomonas daroniae]TBU85726.1 hypothetical protein DNK31_00230 [Pseudomonas sp. FRB 228]TBU94889.1 hypothetical protein DNJ99_00230 [Pseudomonas daroniae]
MNAWSSPEDLRAQLQRLWDQGTLLRTPLADEPLFPLRLRLKKPGAADLGNRFADVRQWIGKLQAGEGDYRLVWKTVSNQQLGRNRIPAEAWVDSPDAALRLIGRQADWRRFEQLRTAALAEFPELHDWLHRQPMQALESAPHWPRIRAVLQWFRAHPRSGLYLRQLDIPGVDSKFIEQRRGLLGELLNPVLADAVHDPEARGASGFSRRYGLREKPVRVRLRLLDPVLYIAGLSDLELPVEQLARLRMPLKRVFVTENETNFLAFPPHPASAILYGQGYALDRLAQVRWLEDQPLHYWGDIDTHGFAILDRLRAYFPDARSLLMDRATLLAHRPLWGKEPADKRCSHPLTRLDEREADLYDDLRHDRVGGAEGKTVMALRLEQEHVRFNWLRTAIDLLD